MITDYINLESLALNLSLPKTYLRRLIAAKKLPFIDTGNGRRRFQEEAVRNALSKIEQQELADRKKPRPTILDKKAV